MRRVNIFPSTVYLPELLSILNANGVLNKSTIFFIYFLIKRALNKQIILQLLFIRIQ